MTYESVAGEFFDSGGFAFFHKQDKLGRPVAVVQMRYFPQFHDKSKSLTDFIRPYACLVMEIVRKIMLEITWNNRNNQKNDDSNKSFVLVSQIAVIIDIGKAPFIPIVSIIISFHFISFFFFFGYWMDDDNNNQKKRKEKEGIDKMNIVLLIYIW